MPKVRVIILRTAGTNCDMETAFAFENAGSIPNLVHINELRNGRKRLRDYHILAIPGGFTYGDDIASGKILANELKFMLGREMRKFISEGKLILGICNGFQALVKAGLLPNISGDFKTVEATLTLNDSAKFEDRWVYLKKPETRAQKPGICVWTRDINSVITLPVAHGEGKFIPRDKSVLRTLKKDGMIVLQYAAKNGGKVNYPDNPNGSVDNIAGICDRTGRVFGLMPHPERHINRYQSPLWTRNKAADSGDGFAIFLSGVNFAKKNL